MLIHNRLSQHVSGIIISIVRRTDCIKPRVVLAWMCWLRLCGVGTRADRTAFSSCPIVNKHLYLCHLLVLSSPTLMMQGHRNLKHEIIVSKISLCLSQAKFGPVGFR